MITSVSLTGFYDYRLVALSVSIAILASYAALDLAGRVATVNNTSRLLRLWGGAVALGTGIWAMHYIGMEAFHLPVPMLYDGPTVVFSLLTAIATSAIALFIVSRSAMGRYRTAAGSILTGCGVAAMHYIGMEAMRIPAILSYSPWLVSLSVLLAIAISFIALRLTFAFKQQSGSWCVPKLGSAVMMGSAILVIHFVGMSAVSIIPIGSISGGLEYAITVSALGFAGFATATLLILSLVILSAIVDRRMMQQAQELAEHRLQMQAIFDNTTDSIIVLDRQRNIVRSNPAAIRLLGLAEHILPYQKAGDTFDVRLPGSRFLAPDEWPSALALRGKFLHYSELEIHRKDSGKVVVTEISTSPIKDGAGETAQIIVSYRDITDRKENLNARARLAAIVDSSAEAIFGSDETGIVTSWNTAAQRIFGHTADDMIGHSIMSLIPAGYEEEESGFFDRIRNGELIDPIETLRKRKDGRLIHVSLTISPIQDANRRVVGASKMARDITERKQLERQLLQSQKMEAIGQLTGGIAHDFNNLLGVIVGNLGLLERLIKGDENALKYARTAEKASWRGADLIRRLLALTSNEELKPSPASLNHSIHHLVELAARAVGPEIRISTQLDDSLPPVFVDLSGLESALLTLAVNSRDAMPNGGVLTIATALKELDDKFPPVKADELKAGFYACVSLSDTGYGMSQETLGRVFEPFFTTKPRGKGTGLGLAMVYGFAKQSGGTVRIYSEIGYGTTVTLYLPLAKAIAQPVQRTEKRPSVVKSGITVLVVDDDLELVELACAYLTEMGYLPLQASDAPSALEIIANLRNIDLVVTDVMIPGGMTGVELVQRIRELIPEIRVIYSSGFSADALAQQSGTMVDRQLLHKPYQQTDFEAAVRRAMQ
jgi:PAS domain S-box-containing protein